MSHFALVISDIDMDLSGIRVFADQWDIEPVSITQGMDEAERYLKEAEVYAVFIRIDRVEINGLKVTRAIRRSFPEVRQVWMACSDGYAISAFQEDVDAYLELPVTEAKLTAVMERLARRSSA